MALKTKLELETLDQSYLGQPFVRVATTAITTENLDLSYQGQPFSATDPAGGVTQQGEAALTVTATLSATATRIKDFNIALTSAFAPTMTTIAIKNTGSVCSAVFSFSADVVRNRSTDIALDTIANVNAQAGIIKPFESSLSTATSLTADVGRLVEADAYLEYEIPDIFIDVEKIISAFCDLTVTASVSTVVTRIKSFNIDVGALFSPSITAEVTKNSTAILDVVASLSASANRNRNVDIALATQANLSAQADKTFAFAASINSNFTQTSIAERVKSFSSAPTSTASQTATLLRIRRSSVALTAQASLTAQVIDLDLATASLTSAFTQTSSATRGRRSAVALNSAATLTASLDKTLSAWRSYHWGQGLREGAVPGSGGTYQHIFSRSSAFDDNENIYELLDRWTEQASSDTNTLLLVKRNSAGDVIWKRQFALNASTSDQVEHAKISYFNDHLYISVAQFGTSAWESRIWKLDLNGDRQWGRVSFKIVDHYVDSTGVYFLSGLTTSDVYKLNDSTGTTAWIGEYSQTVSNVPMSITGDVDYIYFSTEDPHIFALNKSTGAQIWRRRLDLPSIETDRNNYLDVNADDELVIAHDRGNGSSYIVNIDPSTGAANSSKNINIGIRELLIDEYTGQHYLLTGVSTTHALNSDLTSDWSRQFLVSTTLLEEVKHVAFNEYYLLIGGVGVELDLGGGASYLLKNKKDISITYTGQNVRSPYSGTFEFTSVTAPTISTASVSSITSTTGTYSTTTGNLSSDSTNWITNSSTTDYEWINIVDGLSAANTAIFTVAAVPTYIRNAAAALSSSATLSAQPTVIKKAQAALSSQATLTATVRRTRGVVAGFTSVATVSATVRRTRGVVAGLSSSATVAATVRKTASAVSAISSQATIASTLLRIRQSAIATDSVATQLSAVAKVGSALVTIDVVSTLTCEAQKAVVAVGDFSSTFTQSAEAQVVIRVNANLSSSFTTTAAINRTRSVAGSFTAQATVSADIIKAIFADAILTANSQLQVLAGRNTLGSMNVNSAFTVTATPSSQILVTANLVSRATFQAQGRFIVSAVANFTAFNTVLAIGDVIQLDPYLTYVIEQETRLFKITEETRLFSVEQETRDYIITEETREYAIEQNTAVNII